MGYVFSDDEWMSNKQNKMTSVKGGISKTLPDRNNKKSIYLLIIGRKV